MNLHPTTHHPPAAHCAAISGAPHLAGHRCLPVHGAQCNTGLPGEALSLPIKGVWQAACFRSGGMRVLLF